MSIEWKKGPPPEDSTGMWVVWTETGGVQIAVRFSPKGKFFVGSDRRTPGWEAGITHHAEINPPEGEGESP